VFIPLAEKPLADHGSSDYALWATSFGAKIATEVTKYTTHVIANPDRKTTKVKKAARFPHIEIVNAEWLFQACTRWEFVEERPYRIELDEADRSGSPVEQDDSVNVSGGEGDAEPEEPVAALSDDQWKSMDDELADFLNESDTEDTSASESESGASTDSTSKRKRKRGTESDENSEEDDSDASTSSASKLQRRKRRTMDRVSTLHTVVNAEKSSGLPSPETTGPEEEQGEDDGKTFDPQGQGGDLDESDYDDGLEAEMMAQFEKSDSEVEE
jgi:RNA polymerase II subunit A-like phosphatase